MTFLRHLFNSVRVYTGIVVFFAFAFPVILVYISTHSKAESWPFIQKVFSAMLAAIGLTYVVEGLENFDHNRGYMLMGNHINWMDHFILTCAFPRPFNGFEKTANFKVPIYGPMVRKWGNVEITRQGDPEERMRVAERAAAYFREGISFLVYPEGTRSRTGEVGPFKKGGFHTAIGAEAPILPFTYNGAHAFMTAGRWWVQPGVVRITFGTPIESSAYAGDVDGLLAATRAAILSRYEGATHALQA